jgi:hypothetical protein
VRVLDIGDDDPERLRRLAAEIAGQAIVPKVELGGGMQNTSAILRGDTDLSPSTRDTVAEETPARSATCLIFGRRQIAREETGMSTDDLARAGGGDIASRIIAPRSQVSRRRLLQSGAVAASALTVPTILCSGRSASAQAKKLSFWQFYAPGGEVATQSTWFEETVKA